MAEYRKTAERYRNYRRTHSERYNYSWNRTHEDARRILLESEKDKEVCYSCGDQRKTRCHHVDGDAYNNSLENLEWCCYSCDSKQNSRRYVENQ